MKNERKFEQSLEDYESLSKTELLYCHFRIRFTYVGAMSPCIGNWNRNEAVKFFQN
ncbi:IS110 family transposase, partial [Enterococcus faecium]